MAFDNPPAANRSIRYSVCPHDCPSTCALEVEVQGGRRIGKVHGARANSYTAGVICAKVGRYAERIHHPERLTRPLLRVGPKGAGRFHEIGWDEALDRIAEAFLTATARFGSETVWPYYYAGTMGLVMRDGINRLRHVMRYSRQKKTICTGSAEAGWVAGTGRFVGPDPREMAKADLIVVWGGNPVATQVGVMTHITRARKERGARLVVVDPYRSGTAEVADAHLCLRPGTDAALACAVMHCAFRDGHADRAYLTQYTDLPADLEAHLAARGPEWAAAVTGLAVEEIEAFARLYNTTPRAYIRVGYGFTRSRNGSAAMHAVTCLPAVTGAWRAEGGGAFWSNRAIYHWDKTLIEGLDALDPRTREIDMCQIGDALSGDAEALKGGPPITAMLVQNCNPAVVAPDANQVGRGLAREDLFLDGFGTADGRFHFAPDWSKVGQDWRRMPRLPDQLEVIERATPDKPFRLMTSPARQFLNTSFTETPGSRAREIRPTALIHPRDCDRLGLADGDRVRIGNQRGTVIVHARRFDGLQEGVVVVEGIWPSRDFEGGVGINALVGGDPIPPFGGGAFHDTAVWLRPVPAPGGLTGEPAAFSSSFFPLSDYSSPRPTCRRRGKVRSRK